MMSECSNTFNQCDKSSLFDNSLSSILSKEKNSSFTFKMPNSQNLDNEIGDTRNNFNELAKTLDTNFIKMKLVKLEELLDKIDKDSIKQSFYIEIINELKSIVDYMNQEKIKQQNLGIKLEHLMENLFLYSTQYFKENNFESFDDRINQLEQKIDSLIVYLNQNSTNIGQPIINYNPPLSQLQNPRWTSAGTSIFNNDDHNINRNSETLDYKLRELKRSHPYISRFNSVYDHPDEYLEIDEYPQNLTNSKGNSTKRKPNASKLMTEPPKRFIPRLLNENISATENPPDNQTQPKKRGRKRAPEKKL